MRITHSDSTWISEIISGIVDSEHTSKESVQDAPQNENYIKIDIQSEAGVSTLFAYEDNGKYYMEQPDQGIYNIFVPDGTSALTRSIFRQSELQVYLTDFGRKRTPVDRMLKM